MKTIFTIGHSNHDIDRFCSLLHDSKIGILADVRSVPYSRFYPQYNQRSLETTLKKENIQYVFLGDELGGRIEDASCYINGTKPKVKAGYARFLDYETIRAKDWFNSGIRRLTEIATQGACAVMCSEENPALCHRELIIGRRLREMGHTIIHIRTNGEGAEQPGLFE